MKTRFVVILLIGLIFSGCASIQIPFASDKSFPSDSKYEILGPVTHITSRITILGLFSRGGAMYRELYSVARTRYRNTDDVVSVSCDIDFFTVLGIYTRTEYTLRGIAIRYIKE